MSMLRRGTVANNIDPMMLGRVQVEVPSEYGSDRLMWAMPCSPYAGSGVGFFAVPPVGAAVWVAFENDDLERPVVLGGFWGTGEVPASPAVPQMKMLKTDAITMTLSDLPGAGGFTVEVSPPAVAMPTKIAVTSSGIEISIGASKIVLNGVTVSVNDGALEVM
jgi:hypothetical protein